MIIGTVPYPFLPGKRVLVKVLEVFNAKDGVRILVQELPLEGEKLNPFIGLLDGHPVMTDTAGYFLDALEDVQVLPCEECRAEDCPFEISGKP